VTATIGASKKARASKEAIVEEARTPIRTQVGKREPVPGGQWRYRFDDGLVIVLSRHREGWSPWFWAAITEEPRRSRVPSDRDTWAKALDEFRFECEVDEYA
jgi:hypothetical protein